MIYFLDAICQVSMDGYSVNTGAFFQFWNPESSEPWGKSAGVLL